MKRWKRQLAWVMVASMLAGSCMTSYAALPESSVSRSSDVVQVMTASSSDAERALWEVLERSTQSDATALDLDERPAFHYEKKISVVTVEVTAEEGVLPKGTRVRVNAVNAGKAKKLAQEAGSEDILQDVIAFDIKLYDKEGIELDDSWAGNGSVKVSFSGESLEEKQEQADRVEIQHYDAEDSNPEVKEILPGDAFDIEANHFSVFAVSFYGVRAATESNAIYVASEGNDGAGTGTEESPYASLAKAFEEAADGATIYVMSDLTMNASARSWNKHLTVKSVDGAQYTVTRGEIGAVQDNARSTYNPAMFEANGYTGDGEVASLRFENIILDDNGTSVGEYFIQAQGVGSTPLDKEKIPNTDIVQDAIIATYNGVATITLGEGTVLRNFGGMSAVRVSGGKLVMESGSVIEDTTVTDRIRGASGSFGPAGAVWLQGGELEMEEGSEISNLVGRAIYADGGKATVNGTISNVTPDADMWQNDASNDSGGLALHLRGGAEGILGSTGLITELSGSAGGYRGAVANHGSKFTTEDGSVISKITGTPVLYSNYGTDLLNGVIEDSTHDFIIGGFAQKTTIGETGVIQNCVGSGGAARSIVYTSNASQIFLKGTVRDNTASYAFYIINQSGGAASLTMYDGAVLTGKENEDGTYKYSGTGVYVNSSGSSFTMEGGRISGFSTGVNCRGKNNNPAYFTMNGGLISDISGNALYYQVYGGSRSSVNLNGGGIETVYVSGGNANDENERIFVDASIDKDKTSFGMSIGTLKLSEGCGDIYLGNAKAEAKNKLAELLAADEGKEGWTTIGSSALWFKPTDDRFAFKMERGSSFDPALGAYFGYIPLKADGTPAEDAALKFVEVVNAEELDVVLNDLQPGTSYAGIFIHNIDRTIHAADTTIYIGGTGSGLPSLDTYEFAGLPGPKSELDASTWKFTYSIEINDEKIVGSSRAEATAKAEAKLRELFQLTYLDANGNIVDNDLTPGIYTMKLTYRGSNARALTPVPEVKINGNNLSVTEGTLIIRDTKDTAGVKNADSSGMSVVITKDQLPVGLGEDENRNAVAQSTYAYTVRYYTNGDDDREITSTDGIRLMNDKLYEAEEALAEQKAADVLEQAADGLSYVYDMRYLDLVDNNNANAFVTTNSGLYVYFPYPEDVSPTDSTSYKVVYLDVNREYGTNFPEGLEEAVQNAQVKVLDCEKTEYGIRANVEADTSIGGIYILAHATEVNYLNFEDLAFYLEAGQSTEDRIANFPLLRWSVTNSDGTETEIDLTNAEEAQFTCNTAEGSNVVWDQDGGKNFPFTITFWNDQEEELNLSTAYEDMIGTFHAHLAPKAGVTNLKLNGVLLKTGNLGDLIIAPLVDNNTSETFVPVLKDTPTAPVTEKPVAVIGEGTKILVNGVYDLKDEANAKISLLVDHIQKEDNEFGNAIKARLREEGMVDADPDKTGFVIRYLDLVDENDGNVWVKLANNQKMTIYLPYPDGDTDRDYKLFRFSDMHRAYGFDGNEIQNAINTSRIDVIDLEKTELGLKLEVTDLGPVVLAWTIAEEPTPEPGPDPEPEPETTAPVIKTDKLLDGTVGIAYSQKIAAEGDAPLTFTVSEGNLPNGLSLAADGTISGTPITAGTYTFTIGVSNAAGTDSKQFTIVIARRGNGGSTNPGGGGIGTSSGSGSGSRSFTVGIDGQWVHMDPENFDVPISQSVPTDATPVTSPKWHTWKFYLTNGGILRNGWNYIKNPYATEDQPKEGWFAFDENGIMQYGWYLDTATGKWYYLHRGSDGMLGTMETGWHQDDQDGKRYYLNPGTGEMMLGWQKIDDKWYYFNPTAPAVTWNYSEETGGWTFNGSASRPYGSMYMNELTPDGYRVDANGVWTE